MSTATPTPTTLLMSFPAPAGATVVVNAVDRSSAPYRWTCSAGHDGGHAYASLPFCRDDAKSHAAECPGPLVDPSARLDEVAAECRRRSATAVTAEDFDRLLCVQDEMAMCRCQLAQAGRLDLIEDSADASVSPEIKRAVDRFRALSDSIDRVSSRDSHYMTTSETGELYDMQEERARIHARLAAAGRLDLIEVA